MDELIEKIYSRLLEIDEIEEASTMAGGAVAGVITPLGSGSTGRVKYKPSTSTDRKHRKKSKKKKKTYINKSPQYYLKHGGEKSRKRSLQEQNQTPCLTSGAIFSTHIEPKAVGINVNLPFELDLGETEAERLETLLHNAVEMILRPYFMKDTVINNDSYKEEEEKEGRKVIAFDFHQTLVDENEDGTVTPRHEMIQKLKDHYQKYDFIVIYTAAPESDRNLVTGQLHSLGIPYDVLAMEKPRFDKMFDDRYVGPSQEWI